MFHSSKYVRVAILFALAAGPGLAGTALAQETRRDASVVSEAVASRLEGFSFREGPESDLDFRGTALALAADGDAEVEFQQGRARISASTRRLPEPGSLGPYSTYVLWAVTADGRADNLGAIELRDGRGKLKTSTPLSQFGLIVTAEPHFAVTAPSSALVLQNLGRRVRGEKIVIERLAERADYAGLAPVENTAMRGRRRVAVPNDLVQARYAVAIAAANQAQQYAADAFDKASLLLKQAEDAFASRKSRDRKTAPRLAREAVQASEDARRRAALARQNAEAEAQRIAAAETARRDAEATAAAQAERAMAASRQREAEAAREAAADAARRARSDLLERLNRVLPTRDTDRGLVAELSGVQFATGAATLSTAARESLARVAGIVGVYPTLRLLIEGHTDSTGSAQTNRRLSYDRALAVRDFLIRQGATASRIDVTGLGPDRPVAGNDTAEGRARNRRVEIVVSGGPLDSLGAD